MNIAAGIRIHDLGLIIRNKLILSDIHLGFEEAHNKKGILLPRVLFKLLLNHIGKMLKGKRFSSVILNGDIKHDFGSISSSEIKIIHEFLSFLMNYCREIIIVEGNHDPMLKYIVNKHPLNKLVVKLSNYALIGSTYISHGNYIPDNKSFAAAKTIVIGHAHPAIKLRLKNRIELYKCFLVGNWGNKKLIAMPSCNLLIEGTDVFSSHRLSPFLTDIDDFDVYVVSDKTYNFGRLENLRTIT